MSWQIEPLHSGGLLLAKGCVATIFLANALGIVDQRRPTEEIERLGVPPGMANAMTWAGRLLQLCAVPALFVPGTQGYAALALIAFLIPATVIAHVFGYLRAPEAERNGQLTNLLKNAAMIGGLLVVAFA